MGGEMYSYLCEVAKCPKTAPKSTFWAANHPKKSQKEEGEGGEEVMLGTAFFVQSVQWS